VIIGLHAQQQVHNGEVGVVIKAKRDKFEVFLNSARAAGETDAVKIRGAEHLLQAAPKDQPLRVGSHVAIRGLRNHLELNGVIGRVAEYNEETRRCEVRATESGQLFRVKQDNLIPIISSGASASVGGVEYKENREPNAGQNLRLSSGGEGASTASLTASADGASEVFEPGSQVQLTGLKTAMCYNGQTAEVLSVDNVRGRYEIRLGDGSVKTIRSENVKLVAGARSPRTNKGRGHRDPASPNK